METTNNMLLSDALVAVYREKAPVVRKSKWKMNILTDALAEVIRPRLPKNAETPFGKQTVAQMTNCYEFMRRTEDVPNGNLLKDIPFTYFLKK